MFTAETAKFPPTIQIISPVAFSTISDLKLNIEVKATAKHGVDRFVFFLDDRNTPSNTQRKAPFTGSIRLSKTFKDGTHSITAKVYDDLGYVAEAKVEFSYQKPVGDALPDVTPDVVGE